MRLKHPLSISGQTPSKVIFRSASQNLNEFVADVAHARGNGDLAQAHVQLKKFMRLMTTRL